MKIDEKLFYCFVQEDSGKKSLTPQVQKYLVGLLSFVNGSLSNKDRAGKADGHAKPPQCHIRRLCRTPLKLSNLKCFSIIVKNNSQHFICLRCPK
jgi:hypothetical protein